MSAVTVADCTGLWRRTLLVTADGARDTGGSVRWLQGRRAYVDSRGFAGRLAQREDIFTWHRDLDTEPPAEHPDEGRMHLAGATLVERGVHVDYVEHWVREPGPIVPCRAWELADPRGGAALLLQVGRWFAFADGAAAHVDLIGGPRWSSLGFVEGSGGRCTIDGRTWSVTDRGGDPTPGAGPFSPS